MNPTTAMLMAIWVPLVGAFLILCSRRWPNLRETVTLMTAVSLFLIVASLVAPIMEGTRPAVILAEPLPGLPIKLVLEPLGMLFALVASFLWIVTSVYAIGYMRGHQESNQTRFYLFFAVAISAVMGVAMAGNMLTLFVFYEVLTLSTYPLVTHSGSPEARRAGRIYFGVLLSTSIVFLLLAIIGTWHLAGTLEFTAGGVLRNTASPTVLGILLALFVFGIGKAALMPFHRWLPAAMVAPTPVSALLHAVAVVKAGVFTVIKVSVYLFGIDLIAELSAADWLLYLAGASILLASFVAMTKDNLKARLAYSTISQLGYIVLGALLGSASGVIGGAMHIATHAFGKITLFFCAGAILVAAHKTEVSQMRGLGRSMPITMFAFLIGTLSIIGLPPAGGAWSKWYIAMGTLDGGHLILMAVLMVSSLLNVAYLLPIPIRAFFTTPDDAPDNAGIREAPAPCLIAIAVTSLGCLVLFFYPTPLYQLASRIIGP